MSEKPTRIFLDHDINQYQSEFSAGPVFLPSKTDSAVGDGKIFLSPLAIPHTLRQPCIDAKLREALKPVIRDISIIKPKKYDALLKETQAALLEQIRKESADETKEALSDLVALLEENSELNAFLDQFRNLVHKA